METQTTPCRPVSQTDGENHASVQLPLIKPMVGFIFHHHLPKHCHPNWVNEGSILVTGSLVKLIYPRIIQIGSSKEPLSYWGLWLNPRTLGTSENRGMHKVFSGHSHGGVDHIFSSRALGFDASDEATSALETGAPGLDG